MATKQFYIPICVENLANFFAFGFITPKNVFPIGNYIPDELSLHANNIPLYVKGQGKNKILRKGIELTQNEDKYLRSAIILVDIDAQKITETENKILSYFKNIIPTYLIKKIIFEDEKALEDFKHSTEKFGIVSEWLLKNIDTTIKGFDAFFVKTTQDEKSFLEAINFAPKHDQVILAEYLPEDLSKQFSSHSLQFCKVLEKISGYGAALALCYVMVKNSKYSNHAFKQLATLSSDGNVPFAIKELTSYLANNSQSADLESEIRNEFFDVLIDCKNTRVLDLMLSFFDKERDSLRVKSRLDEIKTKAKNIQLGKIQKTKSEQFSTFTKIERTSNYIDLVITMFSYLNDTKNLFYQPIETISDENYINILIAYGFRDKFYNLPREVRQIRGLEEFVIERMYKCFEKLYGNEIPEKYLYNIATFIDILEDKNTPEISATLQKKYLEDSIKINDLLKEGIVISEELRKAIANLLSKSIKCIKIDSEEFTRKMVSYKAFEDINFNGILECYEEEKENVRARNRLHIKEKRLEKKRASL